MTGSFAVKFVGLFAVLLVGVRAIYELWVILGDMSQPVVNITLTLLNKSNVGTNVIILYRRIR